MLICLHSQRLSCAPAEHDAAVAALLAAASQGLKQRKLLAEEVAQFQGAALVAQLPPSGMLTTSQCCVASSQGILGAV